MVNESSGGDQEMQKNIVNRSTLGAGGKFGSSKENKEPGGQWLLRDLRKRIHGAVTRNRIRSQMIRTYNTPEAGRTFANHSSKCPSIECTFTDGSLCEYISSKTDDDADLILGLPAGVKISEWLISKGRVANSLTGIPADYTGTGSFIYAGEVDDPEVIFTLSTKRSVNVNEISILDFLVYMAGRHGRLRVCLDTVQTCLFETSGENINAHSRQWLSYQVAIPKGAHVVSFLYDSSTCCTSLRKFGTFAFLQVIFAADQLKKNYAIGLDEIRLLDKFGSSGENRIDKENYELVEHPALVSSINRSINPCDDFYEYVSITSTEISYEYYLDDQYAHRIKALKEFLTDILEILIEDDNHQEFFTNHTEEIGRRIDSYFEVERKIAQILNQTERHPDKQSELYNLHTMAEVQDLAPSVNWRRYIEGVMPVDVLATLDFNALKINIPNPEALANMNRMISHLKNTSLSDYIDWRMILAHIGMLDSRFQQASKHIEVSSLTSCVSVKAFNLAMYGLTEFQPLWLSCQSDIISIFPDLANILYIKRFFNQDVKSDMEIMVKNIREALAAIIIENDWMDKQTKATALNKVSFFSCSAGRKISTEHVQKINSFIGYDNNLFNQTMIETKYAKVFSRCMKPITEHLIENDDTLHGITVNGEILISFKITKKFCILAYNSSWSFVEMLHAISRWSLERLMRRLTQKNDRNHFKFSSPQVNAYYSATSNQIALFAGILQGAFFNNSLPLSMNYGGIGNVIGHEFTHGFDDQGLLLKTSIDGEATQSENIADNGGVRAAYRAMKKVSAENFGKEKRIRGLEEFNQDQLFFINYAYVRIFINCKIRPEGIVDLLLNDLHSPNKYRVNVVLSNLPEFFSAFNCPAQSSMKMNETCRIW
ncbi:unnamed protein product [Anisakis simplex]|uniref:Peptidase_M13 domain-containing protein n=1 Tax=Anisakis simplex TaxID=6269 RepID=A0A0M3JR68_ANISI|nr:unnamed protein product [Anisakis simplex]